VIAVALADPRDCSAVVQDFVFSVGEQKFFAEKGFDNKPSRCKDCKQAKKVRHHDDDDDDAVVVVELAVMARARLTSISALKVLQWRH
jgi:hypothetical protein